MTQLKGKLCAGRFSYFSIGEKKPGLLVLEWDPCWGKGKAGGLPEVTSTQGFGQKAFLINIFTIMLT